MKFLEKIFTKTKMTWTRVIIFALICGVFPGLFMLPKCLAGTSLQNPGVFYEFWIFAALYIILNCEKPFEAGLKTFVFFLISQPLIYIVQVPFNEYGWQLLRYYPTWGFITLFTLPGGMIAWYTKKGNILSVLILTVANCIICIALPDSVKTMIATFPKFTLTTLFLIFELIFFPMLLFKKRERLISYAISLTLIGIFTYRLATFDPDPTCTYGTYLNGKAPFAVVSEIDGLNIRTNDDMLWVDTTIPSGSFTIILRDADGNEFEVCLDLDSENAYWTTP